MPVEDNIIAPAGRRAGSDQRLSRAARGDRARSTRQSPILKRGIALTPVKFGISFTLTHLNQAGALVHVYQDGSVHAEPRRHRDGAGPVRQGRAGGGGGVRRRPGPRADHRDRRPTRCRTPRRPRPPPAPTSTAWRRRIAARQIKRAAWPRSRPSCFERRRRRRCVFARRPGLRRQREHALRRAREAVPTARASSCPRPAIYRRRRSPGTARTAPGRPFYYFAYGAALQRRWSIDTLTGEIPVAARRYPARCRPVAQPGDRHRPDRGRLRAGHGLADDRGTGLGRAGAAAHPCAVDLQDPGRVGRAGRISACALWRQAQTARRRSTAPRRSASRR